jgi:1-acyl-sn-glycerol-3-phosphate acyltransferase
MNILFRIYLKRVYITGIENIPKDKPYIYACNHPNSFFDAMFLNLSLFKNTSAFARSDAFNTRFKKWFFGIYGIGPIYRKEEGKENLLKNNETFDRGYEVLFKERKGVLLHAEGICVVEKRMRPLKKGTARMAFNAAVQNNWEEDIMIVPVGFNYTYPKQPRSEIMLNFGKPFSAKEFEEEYKAHPAKAINLFNKRLKPKLEEEVIIINKKEDETMTETCFEIFRNDNPDKYFPWRKSTKERYLMEKGIADKVNNLSSENSEQYQELNNKCSRYSEILNKHEITGKTLLNKNTNLFVRIITFILSVPFCFVGRGLNYLPYAAGSMLTKKLVKGDVFYASIKVGTSFVFGLIYYILLLVILTLTLGYLGLGIVLCLPIFAYIASIIFDYNSEFSRLLKLRKAPESEIEDLIKLRKEIIEIVK